jgi:ribosomal protein L37AE/L43A
MTPEYWKQYRAANRDKILAQEKARRELNPEKFNGFSRKWRDENKEHCDEYNSLRPELTSEKASEYYKNRIVEKRCPGCNKKIEIRKDAPTFRPIKYCSKCNEKIRAWRTYSTNTHAGNTHGIKLKVVV